MAAVVGSSRHSGAASTAHHHPRSKTLGAGGACAVSSVMNLVLVTRSLRMVQGAAVIFWQAGTAWLVFLLGFSLAFLREGYSGFPIAIGSVVAPFILMALTARVTWAEVFGTEPPPPAGSSVGIPLFPSVLLSSSSTKPS